MSSEATVIDRHHNEPPLADRLALTHADHFGEAEKLAKRANECPKSIDLDAENAEELAGILTLTIKDAISLDKVNTAKREAEKKPFLDGGRTVDSTFNAVRDRLEKIRKGLNQRLTDYLDAKATRARNEALAEAKRQREASEQALRDAEALDAAGQTKEADAALDQAQQNSVSARAAEKEAAAKPADLARTRTGDATATLAREWVGEIEDFERVSVSQLRAYFTRDDIEKAVRAAVRNGLRALDGVKIYERTKASVR
jgi:hypothetical protein